MRVLHAVMWILSSGLTLLAAGSGYAQDYPNKPIRIVAIGPGGGVDFGARLVAAGLTAPLRQQIVIENRPSGVIPGEIVAKSPSDGYTLLVTGGTFWVAPLLQDRVPYDPVKDFSPVSLIYSVPQLLVAHPSLPVKSVKDLIALAKARPGEINYSSSGPGSSSHLAGALFGYMAKVNIVSIPFRNAGARAASLLGGEVQLEFATAGGVTPHLKSGKLKLLATTSARPSDLFPGVPTIAATVPGYEAVSTGGMFAPAKTSVEIINRLNQEVVRFLNRAETKEKFNGAGVETVGSSPDELALHMKSEMARIGKLVKDVGIRAE